MRRRPYDTFGANGDDSGGSGGSAPIAGQPNMLQPTPQTPQVQRPQPAASGGDSDADMWQQLMQHLQQQGGGV